MILLLLGANVQVHVDIVLVTAIHSIRTIDMIAES